MLEIQFNQLAIIKISCIIIKIDPGGWIVQMLLTKAFYQENLFYRQYTAAV